MSPSRGAEAPRGSKSAVLRKLPFDWQIANALAGRRENCVADGRSDRRNAWFTNAGRRMLAADDLHGRLNGRFVDSSNRIAIEIALHDAAVVSRDFAGQRNTRAEYRRAFELRLDTIRMHDHAGIGDGVDIGNGHVALPVDTNLNHARDIAEEAAVHRDSPAFSVARFAILPT